MFVPFSKIYLAQGTVVNERQRGTTRGQIQGNYKYWNNDARDMLT
jgi:hypothetical protein